MASYCKKSFVTLDISHNCTHKKGKFQLSVGKCPYIRRIILSVVSVCEARYGTCYTLLKDTVCCHPLVDRYLVWY
jgi:hypothetical protein